MWIASGHLPAGARVSIVKSRDVDVECALAGPNLNPSITISTPNAALDVDKFTIPKSALVESDSTEVMQKIEGAILTATKLTGTKYVWGGRTDEGIDCSGLVQMAFKSQGINLPAMRISRRMSAGSSGCADIARR